MSTAATAPDADTQTDVDVDVARPPRVAGERAVRVATAVLLAVLALAGWFLGTRAASYADLQDALRSGSVSEVTVTNGLDRSGAAQAWAQVDLAWREGTATRRATVLQTMPPGVDTTGATTDGVTGTIAGRVDAALRTIDPRVKVTYAEPRSGITATVGDVELPGAGWAALSCVVAGLLLGLLVAGTQPRWATRWAWLWLLIAPQGAAAWLLVVAAFLAAGWVPHTGGRRLNGWLAALVVAPVVAAATRGPGWSW